MDGAWIRRRRQLLSAARVTVFHNGVLIQNHVELTGPTSWLERAPYRAHDEKLPISLQDHGIPSATGTSGCANSGDLAEGVQPARCGAAAL